MFAGYMDRGIVSSFRRKRKGAIKKEGGRYKSAMARPQTISPTNVQEDLQGILRSS